MNKREEILTRKSNLLEEALKKLEKSVYMSHWDLLVVKEVLKVTRKIDWTELKKLEDSNDKPSA